MDILSKVKELRGIREGANEFWGQVSEIDDWLQSAKAELETAAGAKIYRQCCCS